jgi:tetratricopeptide (TPR) repeat protein
LWDEALKYYESSLAIFEEIGDQVGQAEMFWQVAGVYEKQMRLTEAEHLLGQAIAIFERLGSRSLDSARKQLEEIRELQQTASKK